MEEELVLSDFLVKSDLMDETTFDVCLALVTKLVEELVVSDFLIKSDFLVESDWLDENTFDVCLALETKLVEELVVSDFLIESDGMDENTLDVCSSLKTMLLEERISRVGDGWIETTSSCEEWKEETVDVCKLIEFVSITVIVGFTWEVFVAGNS